MSDGQSDALTSATDHSRNQTEKHPRGKTSAAASPLHRPALSLSFSWPWYWSSHLNTGKAFCLYVTEPLQVHKLTSERWLPPSTIRCSRRLSHLWGRKNITPLSNKCYRTASKSNTRVWVDRRIMQRDFMKVSRRSDPLVLEAEPGTLRTLWSVGAVRVWRVRQVLAQRTDELWPGRKRRLDSWQPITCSYDQSCKWSGQPGCPFPFLGRLFLQSLRNHAVANPGSSPSGPPPTRFICSPILYLQLRFHMVEVQIRSLKTCVFS